MAKRIRWQVLFIISLITEALVNQRVSHENSLLDEGVVNLHQDIPRHYVVSVRKKYTRNFQIYENIRRK